MHTVEGIKSYELANGLKVVLFADQSKPTATVNTTYLVGSRHENYGETGMAHLLEHLMFKGSKNYPDPTREFTRRGFRMNGTTWLDCTNYFVSFTANDDNMRWALGWSADAMTNSFIAKKDLDTEMTVVRNEYEMGENKPLSVMLGFRKPSARSRARRAYCLPSGPLNPLPTARAPLKSVGPVSRSSLPWATAYRLR